MAKSNSKGVKKRSRKSAQRPDPRLTLIARAIDLGDLVAASRGYEALLKAYPCNATLWDQYGRITYRQGDQATAFQASQRAVLINPQGLATTINLFAMAKPYFPQSALLSLARWGQIIAPRFAHGYFNHASILDFSANQHEQAAPDYRRALLLNPKHVKAMVNLQRQTGTGRLPSNINFIARGAPIIAPLLGDAWDVFGVTLKQANKLDAAERAYRHALILRPGNASSWYNFGNLMQARSCDEHAIQFYKNALQVNPCAAAFHWNLALSQLLTEDFINGWPSYEWRWKWSGFSSSPPLVNFPKWQGENLNGRQVLVFSEQGLGDSIHFGRYLKTLETMGAKVIFQCPKTLHRLFQHAGLKASLIDPVSSIPHCDFQAALLSLPRLLPAAGASPLPIALPSIKNPKLKRRRNKLNVGLCWAGNPKHHRDHERSINLNQLTPLLAAPKTAFFALQHGPAGTQVDDLGWRQQLPDYGNTRDLFEAAQHIQELDLVISIDSAVAHLAASLGKTTWIMISEPPDWRWHRTNDASRWYPTVRLFRQKQRNNWNHVMVEVAEALRQKAINLGAHQRDF